MWYITSQKFGGNALGLKRVVGFGSYQTAWAWLHKMRRTMVRPGRDLLSGRVEVDEIYVGGVEAGVSGRHTEKKAIVAAAVEVLVPKGFGRLRLRQVPDVSAESLVGFVTAMVKPGSVVLTDGWSGYDPLPTCFTREKTRLCASADPAHVALPGVHRVAALLKRWLLGTYQGSVGLEHFGYYLDEYTFRFNRRASRSRGLLFYRLLQQAVHAAPVPYRQIVCRHQRPAEA
jgi:transposase-like protein